MLQPQMILHPDTAMQLLHCLLLLLLLVKAYVRSSYSVVAKS